MQACGYDAVTPLGTAAARLFKSLSRLHDWPYRPGIAGTARAQSEGWPGDWEGRALLALALLGRTLKTEPAWLEELAAWSGRRRGTVSAALFRLRQDLQEHLEREGFTL